MITYSLKNTLFSILLIATSCISFAQSGNIDDRMKIRLGFTSVNDLHRQILVTVDANATSGIDFGYDAENFENHQDDMYWMIDDRKFVIQGINVIDIDSTLPLGLHTGADGVSTILVDALENVPQDLDIVIFDKENNTYHNIKDNTGFSIDLPAGTYLDRFELRFQDLTEEEEEEDIVENNIEDDTEQDIIQNGDEIKIKFINKTKSIVINNTSSQVIKSVEVYNFSGQLNAQFSTINDKKKVTIETNNLNPGQYIIVATSNIGTTSKKVFVK